MRVTVKNGSIVSGSRRLRLLDLLTYSLLSSALLFSLYCIVRSGSSHSTGAGQRILMQEGADEQTNDRSSASTTIHGGHVSHIDAAVNLGSDITEDYDPAGGDEGFTFGKPKPPPGLPEDTPARIVRFSEPSPKTKAKKLKTMTQDVGTQVVANIGVTALNELKNSRVYHTITTAAGFSNHWQARIHYYWFKRQRDNCLAQPSCDMGGFTRLLHTGKPDDLMDEIPTVVVSPLPPEIMKDSSYIVLNRPYAFLEWLRTASIPEKYILMCEGDHLWVRPMPNVMNGEGQAASRFSYMVPEKYPEIVRKFVGPISDEELKKVPQIGNSPTMVSVKEFRRTAPMWYNTTMAIFNDKEAHEAWNWVLEMYGYALATYRLGQHKDMIQPENMLAHPPFDKEMNNYRGEPFYIVHLTYPMFYTAEGNLTTDTNTSVWGFDKRAYSEHAPPRNLAQPPPNVISNCLFTKVIVDMINEATAAIPCWDIYVANKTVTTVC